MNLRTVTLTAPNATPVVLGVVDYATNQGFTLERSSIYSPPRRLGVADLPLVAGGIVVPGRYEPRSIELAGTIVAPTAEAAHVLYRALVAVVRDRGNTPTTITFDPEGDGDRELDGFLDGEVEASPAGGPYLAYRLRLVCPDPVAYGTTIYTETAGNSPGATMTNAGNAEVYPTITAALSGTVTSLRIGNTTAGAYVQLDDLAAGTTLVIETQPGLETVTLDGTPILGKVAVASRFWALEPGANAVYRTVLAGGGSAAVSVSWRDGWVS
jgi:hypothetical protein